MGSGARSTGLRLPEGLLLGTATAGLQIEGGPADNSWYRWVDEDPSRIADGTHPKRACDHWNRVEEDTRLLADLGCRTHRLGLEWARVEPEEGRFDDQALSRYRYELELIRSAGIVPLVTLHHFTNPVWLEEAGGWLGETVIPRFVRYVERVVEGVGDLVDDWVTINEPSVYLLYGYVFGTWPPGRSSVADYFRGMRTMIAAHEAAYEAIHRIQAHRGRVARVGVAHHVRVFDPIGSVLSPLVANVVRRYSQDVFLERMSRRSDYLGLNYYTRDMVSAAWSPGTLFSRRSVAAGAPVNDLGWEIYPQGLSRVIRRYHDAIAKPLGIPIWITENGTCDAADRFRSRYIADHLAQLVRLSADGIPVERYYHWTLMDNFEWAEGESARFGLYEVDFTTGTRALRPSGELYRRICAERVVPANQSR